MNNFTKLLLVVVFTISGALIAFSQTRSKSEPQEPERIVVERSEVVLDAIVRDKKGRPVTNLTIADFAVYEDGVRQQISSFRLVTRGDGNSGTIKSERSSANQKAETKTIAPATASARGFRNGPAAIDNKPSAVALVFDRLSPDARSRAHAAALAYIAQGLTPDDYVGVFIIDQRLKVLQTFTNDTQLIRKAIDQAEKESSSAYIDSTSQIIDLSHQYEAAIVGDDIFKRGIADILEGQGKSDEARDVMNQPPDGFA